MYSKMMMMGGNNAGVCGRWLGGSTRELRASLCLYIMYAC